VATANPIKLPVIITADGTQAQAGFSKLRNNMQGLERNFGKYLMGQAAYLGGIAGSIFTLDTLFQSIQRMIQHGQKINEDITQYSGEAVKAQAEYEVAVLKQQIELAGEQGKSLAMMYKFSESNLRYTKETDKIMSNMAIVFDIVSSLFHAEPGKLVSGQLEEAMTPRAIAGLIPTLFGSLLGPFGSLVGAAAPAAGAVLDSFGPDFVGPPSSLMNQPQAPTVGMEQGGAGKFEESFNHQMYMVRDVLNDIRHSLKG